MAERSEFLPLGADIQVTDVGGITVPNAGLKNFVPVVVGTGVGGKKNIRLQKRMGYQSPLTSNASGYLYSQGMQWTGLPGTGTAPSTAAGVYVYVADNTSSFSLFKWNTAESTLGTDANARRCIGMQETIISGVPNIVLNMRNIASPYAQSIYFFPDGGALTQITDGDLPTGIVGCGVPMDGYYFFAAGGNIWNTDINSMSAITATSFVAAQSSPDFLVGLAKIGNRIIALGTLSIEQFQNAGNASGSPLQRIDTAAIKIGVLHGRAVQEMGEGLLFVSNSRSGVDVRYMQGADAKKVSTTFIDKALSTYAFQIGNAPATGGLYNPSFFGNFQIMFCGVAQLKGVEFAILLIGASMYGYAPSLDLWIEVAPSMGVCQLFSASSIQFALDINHSGTNSILRFGEEAFTTLMGQDAANFAAEMQTGPITHGTSNRKQYNWLRIVGPRQTVSTPIIVSYSDDDGATFTTWGTIDMSAPAKLTRGGQNPNDGTPAERIFKLSNTSAAGCDIYGVEVGIMVLQN